MSVTKKRGAPVVALRFHPQAWINDWAVDVDPEGETTWTMPRAEIAGALPRDNSRGSDELRRTAHAPEWVRNWRGPFWVEITNRDDLEATEDARVGADALTSTPAGDERRADGGRLGKDVGAVELAADELSADLRLAAVLQQQPQRQDGTDAQLRTVMVVANRLGCYDAADVIRGLLERRR